MKSIVVLLCLSLSVVGQSLTWVQHPSNGSEYALSSGPLDWHLARAEAQSFGADLVVIASQTENDWIAQNVSNAVPGVGSWIGLTDEAMEGTWVWVDGTPANYTNWAPPEPNNGYLPTAQPQNHVQIYSSTATFPGQWDDDWPAQKPAIYERPTLITYAVSMDPSTLAGTVSLNWGEPLAPYFMLQSNDPFNATLPGTGLAFGLHISPADVAWQFTAGVAGNPLFGGTLDANGAFSMSIPGAGVFLSGQTFWGMGIQQLPTGVYAPSNIASITF